LRSGAVCVQSHAGCGEGQPGSARRGAFYCIAERDLTPARVWSLPKLRKTWNQIKGEVAPWWQANSKEAYNTGLDGLARALQNWSTSRSGERASAAVGFPKFKTRHRRARSVRFITGVIRV
jgi:putative transposase